MTIVNQLMTGLFDVLFAPLTAAPGWLSLLIFSALTALLGLIVYKYTSNQNAIKRTKDRIKAHILAIKLFKDDLGVIVKSMFGVLYGSMIMLRYALLPLAVMIVPFVLLLAQLGLRYQWRPLQPGETTVVTAQFADDQYVTETVTTLETEEGVVIEAPPVRVTSERKIVWRLHGSESRRHVLKFHAGSDAVEKSFDVGAHFERVNPRRSSGGFWDAILYPAEPPIPTSASIVAITVEYPARESLLFGADYWLVWLILISFVLAFALKPIVKVEF